MPNNLSVEKHAGLSYLLKEKLSVGVAFLEARPLANVDSFLPAVKTYLSLLFRSGELSKLSIVVNNLKHRYVFYS